MKGKDIEMRSNRKVSLTSEHSESWFSEATAIDYGMIVLCREGEATIGVNFLEWRLKKGSVITFPQRCGGGDQPYRRFRGRDSEIRSVAAA